MKARIVRRRGTVDVVMAIVASRNTAGSAEIDHLDRERVVTVGANVQGRAR